MNLEEFLRALALDTGETLFAIDETRVGGFIKPVAAVAAPPAANGVQVIPLQGALSNRGYGRTMADFRDRINAAVANPDVGAIVLDVDSPGGTVAGTPETAAVVAQAASQKRVVAVVDTLCASAAYWIASQAHEIVMTPSAEIGSIGVLAVHMDLSEMLKNLGVTATVMRSVPAKAEMNPFEPLSAAAQDNANAEIQAIHSDFVRAVAQGRNTNQSKVSETFGQGRTVRAARAVQLGMADRIGTLHEAVAGLRTKSGTIRRRSAIAFC